MSVLPTHLTAVARPPGRPWVIPELASYSGLSERHLRRMIAAGKLKVVRFGRKVTVPDAEVARLLTEGC